MIPMRLRSLIESTFSFTTTAHRLLLPHPDAIDLERALTALHLAKHHATLRRIFWIRRHAQHLMDLLAQVGHLMPLGVQRRAHDSLALIGLEATTHLGTYHHGLRGGNRFQMVLGILTVAGRQTHCLLRCAFHAALFFEIGERYRVVVSVADQVRHEVRLVAAIRG